MAITYMWDAHLSPFSTAEGMHPREMELSEIHSIKVRKSSLPSASNFLPYYLLCNPFPLCFPISWFQTHLIRLLAWRQLCLCFHRPSYEPASWTLHLIPPLQYSKLLTVVPNTAGACTVPFILPMLSCLCPVMIPFLQKQLNSAYPLQYKNDNSFWPIYSVCKIASCITFNEIGVSLDAVSKKWKE